MRTMKKVLVVLVTVLAFNLSNAQNSNTFVGLGFSLIDEEPAVSFDVAVYGFYLGISSNYATGNGTELDFSSSYTRSTNKQSTSVINLGYFIPLTDNFAVAPIFGIGSSRDIYEDNLGFPTYFYGNSRTYYNLGVKVVMAVTNDIGFMAGVGTFENFQTSLIYKF